jgi:hypothetical protein
MSKIDTEAVLRTMRAISEIDTEDRAAIARGFMVQIFRGFCEQYLDGKELEDMNAFISSYQGVMTQDE